MFYTGRKGGVSTGVVRISAIKSNSCEWVNGSKNIWKTVVLNVFSERKRNYLRALGVLAKYDYPLLNRCIGEVLVGNRGANKLVKPHCRATVLTTTDKQKIWLLRQQIKNKL